MATVAHRRENNILRDALGIASLLQRQEVIDRENAIAQLKTAQTQQDLLDARNDLQGRGGIVNAIGRAFGQKDFLGTKDPLTKNTLKNVYGEQLPEISGATRQMATQAPSEGRAQYYMGDAFKNKMMKSRGFNSWMQRQINDPRSEYSLAYQDIVKSKMMENPQAPEEEIRRMAYQEVAGSELDKRINDPRSSSYNAFKKSREGKEVMQLARSQEAGYRKAKKQVENYNRVLKQKEDFDNMGPSQYFQYAIDGFDREFSNARSVRDQRKAILKFRSSVQSGDDYYMTNQARGLDRFLLNYKVGGKGKGKGGKLKEFHLMDERGNIIQTFPGRTSDDVRRRARREKIRYYNIVPASTEPSGKTTRYQEWKQGREEALDAEARALREAKFKGQAEEAYRSEVHFGNAWDSEIKDINEELAAKGNPYRYGKRNGKLVMFSILERGPGTMLAPMQTGRSNRRTTTGGREY